MSYDNEGIGSGGHDEQRNSLRTPLLSDAESGNNDNYDEGIDILYSKAELEPDSVSVNWRSFRRGKPIRFLPTGITWHNNGTFTLCHSKNKKLAKALSMTKSGRINLSYDIDNDGVDELPNNRKVKC